MSGAEPKKILILGATGMLGHELARGLDQQFVVISAVRDIDKARRHGVVGDLVSFDAAAGGLDELLDRTGPAVVINAVGLVKQLPGGQDPCSAIRLNALFPHELARACRRAAIRLVHVSTDCVFSGQLSAPQLYTEEHNPDPMDVYGRTKLLGEVLDPPAITLRTSIIGWELDRVSGLLEWLASQRGGEVSGFTQAHFSGLTTYELARVIGMILCEHPDLTGLWHVASKPVTKYDLLLILNRVLQLNCRVVATPEPVINRAIDASRFERATGYRAPDWEALALTYASRPRCPK